MALASCGGSGAQDSPFLSNLSAHPEDMQKGCRLARTKCVPCHTVDYLLRTEVSHPKTWQRYVGRMRLLPGATISRTDAPLIVKCLVYRSFGDEGLAKLEETP